MLQVKNNLPFVSYFKREREREQIKNKIKEDKNFNKTSQCIFLNKEGLCQIHSERPIDCRLFPFDIMNINKKFIWIIWKINSCPIAKYQNFEEVLKEFEKEIIPEFKEDLEEYSNFRTDELKENYKFEILREVKSIQTPQ